MPIAQALTLALGLAAAQALEQALPVPVTLDVVVRDARGRDVETLTPADFVITEDGQTIQVLRARFVKAAGGDTAVARQVSTTGSAEDRAGGDARVFGIFLDEYHVTAGARADQARDALARWVRETLGPGDLVVVLKPLDSLLSITLSDNPAAAADAIAAFEPRRGDYAPRTSFERNFIAGAPASIDLARAQIAASSLHALVTRMGHAASARKTLIVLSEGFAAGGTRRRDGELPGLDSVAVAANRAHVSIYPIDPSETAPANPSTTAQPAAPGRVRERLDLLARETGGEVLNSDVDLAKGFAGLLRDASGYYSLSLTSDRRPDGRLHPVTVSMRKAGLTVRTRKGYWSPSEAEIRPPVALTSVLPFASTRLVPRRTSTLIRPWFGLSKGQDGSRRVDFTWEPTPTVPGDRVVRPVPARIALSVTTADGAPVFSGVVLPTSAIGDANRAPSRVSFESPAGRLLVEMAIEDATNRVVDHDVRDLAVNALDGPVNMGTAEVLRARNAREHAALLADPYAPPAATRTFRRTEQLIVRIPVFGSRGAPTLTARLVSELGGPMRTLTVSPVPERVGVYQVELPLASLAAGAYAIEFQARESDAQVSDRLAFRITP